jgi:putative flippase GtrA
MSGFLTIADLERPSVLRRWRASATRLTVFGLVGGVAFLVDFAVYNLLRATVLSESPIWSKVFSVGVSMMVAWLGNRYFTFKKERSNHALKEGVLFAMVNFLGLLIATGCLFVSHYLLGFTSQLADNISGNFIGLVLGTAFRFTAYKLVVFRVLDSEVSDASTRETLTASASPTAPELLLENDVDLSHCYPARRNIRPSGPGAIAHFGTSA